MQKTLQSPFIFIFLLPVILFERIDRSFFSTLIDCYILLVRVVSINGRTKVNLQKHCCIKDTHKKKAPSNKTPALTKITNTGIWLVGTSNKLFIRDSYTETRFSKK